MKTEIIKICKVHGRITADQCYLVKNSKNIRCKLCRREQDKKRDLIKESVELDFTIQKCMICKDGKTINDFSFSEWKKRNPMRMSCRSSYSKAYRFKQMEKKFGISEKIYYEMLNSQYNRCAICNQLEASKSTDLRSDKTKALGLDHNHKTNKPRELLCGKCNTAIGLMNESSEIFYSAARYLERHS